MKKKYILKKNYDVEKILKKNKKTNAEFIIYYNYSNTTKVCFSVPKKLGNAVARNKKRRQMKAIVRTELHNLIGNHYVIIVKKNVMSKSFYEMDQSLRQLISNLKD